MKKLLNFSIKSSIRLFSLTLLFLRFVKTHLLCAMEYKGWWLTCLHVLFSAMAEPLVIVLMFARFGNLGEWTLPRILFIYSIAFLSFSIAKFLCTGFDYFINDMVRGGDFDRLLLRPKPLALQVAASRFNIQRLANPVAALIIMAWAISQLGISFSITNSFMLAFALLGGFCFVPCGIHKLRRYIIFCGRRHELDVRFYQRQLRDYTYTCCTHARRLAEHTYFCNAGACC